MRNRMIGLALALSAALACSSFLFAQTSGQQGMASVESPAPTSDLSGLWIRLRDPSHSPINLDFGNAISPMTPWGEAKFKAANSVYRSSSPNTVLSDPIFSCFPPGVPRVYMHPFPFQFIQTTGEIVMLFEVDSLRREIYIDAQHDPSLVPLWMGNSVGHWEGDTLVVDTNNFNDRTWIDRIGHPHSDQLHVIERFRRTAQDHLVDDITIDDPKAYTKPWTARLEFKLRPWKLTEQFCEDGETFLGLEKKEASPAK